MNTEKDIQEWIDSMKIALLEKDSNKAFELTQNLPFNESFLNESFLETRDFTQQDNATKQEYLAIIRELLIQAIELLQDNQNEVKAQLDKIRQTRKFFI